MDAVFEISRDHENMLSIMPRSNNVCPPHFHSNIEIVYVFDGEIEVTINNKTCLMSKGYSSIVKSYDVHTYRTPERSDALVLIIPVSMVEQFVHIMKGREFESPFLPPGPHCAELEYAIKKLEDYYELNQSNLAVTGQLYVILSKFIENLTLREAGQDKGTISFLREVLTFLEEHYLEPLTLDDLAKKFGYNKYYISRLFNSVLECGFNRYINILRVRHAATLIRTTASSFEQIAFESGFQNSRNLNRYFQIFYHTTPKEYKRQFYDSHDLI